jgi:hypothetical protein
MWKLEDDALNLLTAIHRGGLVAAIEKRQENKRHYDAADFYEQLDGLGYDEVLGLAAGPGKEAYITAAALGESQVGATIPQ